MYDTREGGRFLLIGAGIASLAAAAFLIRDAGVPGSRIRILDAGTNPGGALRSAGRPGLPELFPGNAVRTVDEAASGCLWDLLRSIPTLTEPHTSVLDDLRAAAPETRADTEVRLISAGHDAAEPGSRSRPDPADRRRMLALLTGSDRELAGRRIDHVLPAHLLASDFWILWSAAFRLRAGSSALDLRTSLTRHPDEPPRLRTLAGLRAHRGENQSIIRPLYNWLLDQGVAFTFGATIADVHFALDADGGRRATGLSLTTRGRPSTLELGPHDHLLVTLGSMTADAAFGDDDGSPDEPDPTRRDGAWRMWETLARRHDDFGRPSAFTGHVEDSAWLSFILSTTGSDLHWQVSRLTGGRADARTPITFRDSPWLLTLAVPDRPYFTGSERHAHIALGYGMRLDARGDHVPATLLNATGRQILDEVIGQLGMDRCAAAIRATTKTSSVLLPYAGSPLLPRRPGDRPDPVPPRARNFAFLGQYVEIPGEVAFSMEYSVRSAMHAVYGLLGIDRAVPAGSGLDGATI